ncbi:TetR/AcrR family transcriptional regulator [Virgibacillus siamensis]|uniref:TetR/AcrR family transcriptional regulator n=1 Tax=Virgibacillus siamensis TaxID=480071 RepID=UPI003183AB14
MNAALEEFAENGYERASTNQIIKNAGIGKGMLFYYFGSKKELYHYLVSYALDVTEHEYLSLIDMNETDFIKRLKHATHIKMKCFVENPSVFNFLGTFLLHHDTDLPENLEKRYEQLMEQGQDIMYANIDKSLFREDVDVKKAFKLIQWALDGYQNEIIARLKGEKMTDVDFTPYWEEFYGYLDVLKKCFYQ